MFLWCFLSNILYIKVGGHSVGVRIQHRGQQHISVRLQLLLHLRHSSALSDSQPLKGTVSLDFLVLVFFSWISFPPVPEYPIRTVLNFFENSRRYSQLKVDHRCRWDRWQMKKIFNQKNFKNFVGTPLDSRVNIYIFFAFKFTLGYLQPDINPIVCHRYQQHLWNWWQICRRCCWYRWSTLSCKYLREFSKKFETAVMVYSGAWGKLIHEKTEKEKISWHCPFLMDLEIKTQSPLLYSILHYRRWA